MSSADDGLAPVIPLFGGAPRLDDPAENHDDAVPLESDADEIRQRAEEALVRKLRAKQLSVSEARSVLRENGLDRDAIDDVIDEFLRRSYLDDHTLASLLVTSGSERKGQGRIALARSLGQRGIPRDIVDDALAELPDDDAERALEFARSKASGMSRLDYDTALRRLHGQLARRGYGGSVAMNAARTALGEVGVRRATTRPSGAHSSGVRFVDSD
ncbi:regulatory protein RecX [Microbacterium sp. NPDC055521]